MLETSPATFSPGSEIEVLVSIGGSGVNAGGIYISTEDVGQLEALPGEGLAPVVSGLVHVQPKAAQGGQVDFRFAWTAPSTAGAVRFYVYALGANGNAQRSGDSPAEGFFDRVYGCEGQEYFFDGDGDGFGRSTGQGLMACAGAPPPNYAAIGTDCIDYDAGVYPGAAELCNKKDDDCNGEIDENAEPIELWPDGDGDGFYERKEGESVIGCVGLPNYAGFAGDCDDGDAAIYPEAEETCNYRDDDCDGEVDEGALCASGEHCLAGECVPTDTLVVPGIGGAPASGGSTAAPAGSSSDMPKPATAESSCAVSRSVPGSSAPWILGLLTAAFSLRRLASWRRGPARRAA